MRPAPSDAEQLRVEVEGGGLDESRASRKVLPLPIAVSARAGTPSSSASAIAPAITAAGRSAARAASSTRATTLPVSVDASTLPSPVITAVLASSAALEARRIATTSKPLTRRAPIAARPPARPPAAPEPGQGQDVCAVELVESPARTRSRTSSTATSAGDAPFCGPKIAGASRKVVVTSQATSTSTPWSVQPSASSAPSPPSVVAEPPTPTITLPAAAGDRGGDELAGAVRRRGQRVVARDEREAAGAGHLDDRGAVGERRPFRVDGGPSGPVTRVDGACPARAQDRGERPLAAVGERQRPRVEARPLDAAAHRRRRLGRGEAAAELVGATEDGHQPRRAAASG